MGYFTSSRRVQWNRTGIVGVVECPWDDGGWQAVSLTHQLDPSILAHLLIVWEHDDPRRYCMRNTAPRKRHRNILHREAEKKSQFSFVCIFLVLDRNWWFLTYIRPKKSRFISYNPVYLILAFVENFAATVTLNILCLPIVDYRLVFIVSISLLCKNS